MGCTLFAILGYSHFTTKAPSSQIVGRCTPLKKGKSRAPPFLLLRHISCAFPQSLESYSRPQGQEICSSGRRGLMRKAVKTLAKGLGHGRFFAGIVLLGKVWREGR
jgi:hypothetical protein